MHADNDDLVIVRTIEYPDASALGQAARRPPEEIVFELVGARLLETNTSQPCGLTPDMT